MKVSDRIRGMAEKYVDDILPACSCAPDRCDGCAGLRAELVCAFLTGARCLGSLSGVSAQTEVQPADIVARALGEWSAEAANELFPLPLPKPGVSVC